MNSALVNTYDKMGTTVICYLIHFEYVKNTIINATMTFLAALLTLQAIYLTIMSINPFAVYDAISLE